MENKVNKIMYVFNDSFLGGAAISLLDTLNEIKKEVDPIIIMREGVKIKDSFEALDISCYEIRFSRDYVKCGEVTTEKKEIDFKQSYEAAMQLLPIIVKEKVQLIHINSSVSYFAAIAALTAKIPFIWHIRELMEEQFGCEFVNKELKRALYVQADRVISISDYVKRKYDEKYSIHTQKIYNGINIEKYKINIDENIDFKNIFLVAAKISPEKGQWDAICATEILLKKGYSDVQLIIVGANGGSYVWALDKYIKTKNLSNNIKILPFQSDLSELHKQASYAITCSQNEALGRVTIEAMLAGNVLIGAESGGTTEIIGKNEDRGFLYELHNSEALANVMIRAMQCPKEIKKQMIKKAQTYAEDMFDSRKYCKKLIDVYSEVISLYKPKDQNQFLYDLNKHYSEIEEKKFYEEQDMNRRLTKLNAAFSVAIKWLEIKQKGYSLAEYFKRNNIQSVAIYGMAALGCRLYDELENIGIKIKYLLDKNPDGMEQIFEFTTLDNENLAVDVIVVTVAAAERQIVKELQSMGHKKVIGLSDILNDFI